MPAGLAAKHRTERRRPTNASAAGLAARERHHWRWYVARILSGSRARRPRSSAGIRRGCVAPTGAGRGNQVGDGRCSCAPEAQGGDGAKALERGPRSRTTRRKAARQRGARGARRGSSARGATTERRRQRGVRSPARPDGARGAVCVGREVNADATWRPGGRARARRVAMAHCEVVASARLTAGGRDARGRAAAGPAPRQSAGRGRGGVGGSHGRATPGRPSDAWRGRGGDEAVRDCRRT